MMAEMKRDILLGALLLPMLTFGIRVSDLSVCEYADTEAATNLPSTSKSSVASPAW